MTSRVYTIGLYNWPKTKNKFKVFFNVQAYKNKALSIKGIYIKKSKIKTN